MTKILIADDSKELADFLATELHLYNFETEVTSSKAELITQTALFKPDIILLDVLFNHYDGREWCKKIKATSNVQVILSSVTADLLVDFEQCKADDVIEKPFEIKMLVDKINRHIHTLQVA